jgi:CBS domain-containing protein
MKTVRNLLAGREVYAIQRDITVHEAGVYMASKHVGAVPVLEGTRLVGIFSERDVVTRVVARGSNPKATKVEDVMTKDLVVAGAGESCESCLWKMKQAACRHLPIVEEDKLLGVISLRDLLMVEIDEKAENIEFLHNYLFTVPGHAEKKYKA